MTATGTFPISGPLPASDTAAPSASSPHEHAWLAESRHPTSEGLVFYVRCTDCDARRVDLQPHPLTPPTALSRATVRP